ncbi:DUF5627 domain-containing protein [Pontibacter sp. SGAir0037]|uniref:DUF5627 domain-containing protein n=1 Tax=Pontibacter sp. SGAir0037 TaxID=2571030 RepID=UPI0010CCC2B2|nr:DUF5627 domain-containing protein [Pontibacter sp. SGAir0037]QCR22372.1 adhesin [Pontibacter sp. SGAir0037]
MKKICFNFLALLAIMTSCENQEMVFPDYDYQSTYFAYQFPVRTITLGEDIVDTSLDNARRCKIMATTGGVYDNKKDVTINITVDNSLVEGFLFNPDDTEMKAMPASYYSLVSDKIVIPPGSLIGGVEVELKPEFFGDPLALEKNYVIPVRMTSVQNADTILSGKPLVQNPRRGVADDWNVAPKDYVFYAVKYINPWHGFYLRRGKDVIEGKNGNTSLNQTVVRQKQYVEEDELIKLTTQTLSKLKLPVVYKDTQGRNINADLLLTFDEQGNCTVSANSTAYTATGSGKFVKRGEKKSWGNTDRDALYLNYTINFDDITATTTDTLVMRNRGVAIETFSPVQK